MANNNLATTYTLYLLASATQSGLNGCLTGQLATDGTPVNPSQPPTTNAQAVQRLQDYSKSVLGVDLSGREGDLSHFFDAGGSTTAGWAERIPALFDYPGGTSCPVPKNEKKIASALRKSFPR